MINIVFVILIFWLGFCFGNLLGLKRAEQINDDWALLASKANDDWYEYCQTLIEKIKTLEKGDTDDR